MHVYFTIFYGQKVTHYRHNIDSITTCRTDFNVGMFWGK